MTVRELMIELADRDPDALVYVPRCRDGKNGLAAYVCRCQHLDVLPGISISDDVAILPMEMGDYVQGGE